MDQSYVRFKRDELGILVVGGLLTAAWQLWLSKPVLALVSTAMGAPALQYATPGLGTFLRFLPGAVLFVALPVLAYYATLFAYGPRFEPGQGRGWHAVAICLNVLSVALFGLHWFWSASATGDWFASRSLCRYAVSRQISDGDIPLGDAMLAGGLAMVILQGVGWWFVLDGIQRRSWPWWWRALPLVAVVVAVIVGGWPELAG